MAKATQRFIAAAAALDRAYQAFRINPNDPTIKAAIAAAEQEYADAYEALGAIENQLKALRGG